MDFVDEVPTTTLTVHVYPEGTSEYTLYEDDGDTLAYLEGTVATTAMHCDAQPTSVTVKIDPRQGRYKGMPATRDYNLHIHTAQPKAVTVNGQAVEWHYDASTSSVALQVAEDTERQTPIIVTVVAGS